MSGQLSFTPLFGQLSVTPPYTSPSANKSSDRGNTRQYAVDLLSCSISRMSENTIATPVTKMNNGKMRS
jgi:hypothetical protein